MEETVGLTLYIDDAKILNLPLSELENGRIQAFGGYDEQTGEMVVKVVNAFEKSTTATIHLNANGIASSGTVTSLSTNTLSDENTLDNPRKIYPRTTTFDGFAEEFQYTFKPCSFTIFRIKADASSPSALEIPKFEWDDTPIKSNEAEIRQTMLKNTLKALISKSKAVAVENSSGVDNLNTTIDAAQTLMDKENATNKALDSMISKLQSSLDKYVTGLMDTNNEFTSKLKNPNFTSMQTTGWQGNTPSLEHNVGEFFNTNFDMYQTLSNLEPGKYLIYVQGFYRNGSHDEAYPKHQNGTERLLARLYAGNSYIPIRSIYDQTFDQGSWNHYLDNRAQAETAFNSGPKTLANYLVATVGSTGKIRVGIKKSTSVLFDWTCFNNFRIFFIPQAEDTTGIDETREDTKNLVNTDLYDLSGRRVKNTNQKGIIIRNGKKVLIK